MRMVDIIIKKRDGFELTDEEIAFFIKGYVNGSIPDYQASALCMAILFKGMTKREIVTLTKEMQFSGDVVDFSSISGIKSDKHSTGGVGDKTSLALGPILAACGVKLAKMSGRGLGHTGGTLDKLESIPGIKIFLSDEEIVNQVNKIGIAIIGQTVKLDPADKKLYALRDVTGTVQSLPLIASSIMSKKLASGTDTILIDVKFGSGAFMKTKKDALELGKIMCEIGNSLGRDTRAVLTDMDQPLGLAVGNALEVKEAIDTLKGHGPEDFSKLCLESAVIILDQAKITSNKNEAYKMIEDVIKSGKALEKFKEMVKMQGGDTSYIDDPSKFPLAKNIIEIKSKKDGYIKRIDALEIGISAMKLGAGRETFDDKIDMSAGIVLQKKIGDFVKKGEVLCYAHTNKNDFSDILDQIYNSYKIVDEKIEKSPGIHEYIR